MNAAIDDKLKKILLQVARLAIEEEFAGRKLIDRDALVARYPQLAEKRAVFVTLNKERGAGGYELRGCIGSIIPVRPLIDDVIHNAKAAAFQDPRFPPLTPEELPHVRIEISILTIPQKVEYTDTEHLRSIIRPGIDGVILRLGARQATFLPQVWEQLPDFDLFFAHLCQKAGLPANCLVYHPEIYVYQVEKFEEDE
ncbi:MAG: AmmeMemoRadiSam system protein A [Chlorobi bacterium]|nr:AmmeMemoRadiSam system protein A [Chlorobiota bacterium]